MIFLGVQCSVFPFTSSNFLVPWMIMQIYSHFYRSVLACGFHQFSIASIDVPDDFLIVVRYSNIYSPCLLSILTFHLTNHLYGLNVNLHIFRLHISLLIYCLQLTLKCLWDRKYTQYTRVKIRNDLIQIGMYIIFLLQMGKKLISYQNNLN